MTIAAASTHADILGESPQWCARSRRLYWVDVRAPALNRLDPVTGIVERWSMPEVVAAVILRAPGGVVLSMRSGLHVFDPETQALAVLLPVDEGHDGNRLNDSKCDRAGRLWFSTMWDFGARTTGALYRLERDLSLTRVREGVTVPNAIAFAPDDRAIYFADTPTGRMEVADYGIAAGTVGDWRTLAPADAAPGRPDGATVDRDGFVWNARYGGGCLARFAPDGRLDRLVKLPVSQPSACAFGGADLGTLFVTTSRQKLDDAALAAEPLAGKLLMLRPGVTGIEEPRFEG